MQITPFSFDEELYIAGMSGIGMTITSAAPLAIKFGKVSSILKSKNIVYTDTGGYVTALTLSPNAIYAAYYKLSPTASVALTQNNNVSFFLRESGNNIPGTELATWAPTTGTYALYPNPGTIVFKTTTGSNIQLFANKSSANDITVTINEFVIRRIG